MPRSVHSMMRHGLISTKAYNSTLAKTRSQKSKMTEFDNKSKTDASDKGRGAIKAGEINASKHQRMTGASGVGTKPTRGGSVGGSKQTPTSNAINKPGNAKMFPHGKHMTGKDGIPPTPARVRGTTSQRGPMAGTGQK